MSYRRRIENELPRRVLVSYVLLLAVMVWSLRCASARTRFVLLDFRWSRTPRRRGIDLKEPLLIDYGEF